MEAASCRSVSFNELLAAKDHRAARQTAALSKFRKPLVSATVVMPGPTKDGWLPGYLMETALLEMDALISANHWPLLSREVFWRNTGPEAIYVIDAETQDLKSATVELEDHHPIGRLWDLDVIAPGDGLLSRNHLDFPARRCLVCERPAHECGRSRRHRLEELLEIIRRMVSDFDLH